MKKIVIAPDSFKGTMSSVEVSDIIEKAIRRIKFDIETVKIPIADGGEGTVQAFLSAMGGEKHELKVKGPLFDEVDAFYAVLKDEKTAVIEMAAASGLPLVGDRKNPCLTTTYGTGQLMADALDKGCTRIIIGIGGSATNDGGIGMASALGVRFLDNSGEEVVPNGNGLGKVEHIDVSDMDGRLKKCDVMTACDVDNPLYGPNGAAYVYAPQKGADEEMVRYLNTNLEKYSYIVGKDLGIKLQNIPGAGAAGGLGAGLAAFAGARLQPGIKIILDMVKFESIISDADMIITGEGRIDGSSLRGKVPVGIADRAQKEDIPVVVIAGDVGDDIDEIYKKGINAVFSINRLAIPFKEARSRSRKDLEKTVESIMRFASIFEQKNYYK